MHESNACISCATIKGVFEPPGGVVYEWSCWMVILRANPVQFPCLPLILLKRHVEDISHLTPEESSTLGTVMQVTSRAVTLAFQPAKVHFGIYAESVKHIHVHVFPRMPDMPAGNIPNQWIGQWLELLHAVGLKMAYSFEEVARYARTLRDVFQTLESPSVHV
jgi:diadenosine tetraphosphate (Ap4A) HIT family hydrolase